MVYIIIKEGAKVFGRALLKTISSTFTGNYMTEDEAIRVLDIETNSSQETIFKKYEKLYNGNSPKNKGSEYIQKIILNAYKILKKNE